MHRSEPWTQEEIVQRLREAGDTVRRLPKPRGPAGYGSGWPDVVRDAREAYGYTEGRLKPAPPTPRAIDRTEEVFTWFRFLDGQRDEMRALWIAAGCGVSFAHTARILGIHRKTCRMWVWASARRIVAGLNAPEKNPH